MTEATAAETAVIEPAATTEPDAPEAAPETAATDPGPDWLAGLAEQDKRLREIGQRLSLPLPPCGVPDTSTEYRNGMAPVISSLDKSLDALESDMYEALDESNRRLHTALDDYLRTPAPLAEYVA